MDRPTKNRQWARVVRGPDWEYGEQDGGVGHVGVAVLGERTDGWVCVIWPNGETNNYHTGFKGKFDLRAYDFSDVGMYYSKHGT